MMRSFLILIFVLSFLKPLLSLDHDTYRLSHEIKPVFQFISLRIDPDEDRYSGSTRIELEFAESSSTFRLHGKDFEITHLSFIQNNKKLNCDFEFQEFGLLRITPQDVLVPGRYQLEVEFRGAFSKKGEGIIKFKKDSLNYIYTQMEDIYARQCFPCFDEPGFKFPYQLEITAPKEFLIVSNTREEKVTLTDDLKTVLFKETKPLPSYLLAFAVGPYEETPIPDLSVPGRILLPKGYIAKSNYGKSIAAKILAALESYFKFPYPYEKLDFIGVSNYNFGAMENPGLIVYLDNFLIDPDQLPLSSKYYIAYVIAHEMAHMWFGNLVTLEWWDDAWLNEGFATWVAGEIVLKAFPELNSMDALYGNFTRSVQEDLAESIKPVVRSIKGNDKPLEAFDALSYSKSQVVLRMLENWIGRDNFRFGLQTYFTKYKWSNTTSDDLLNTMAAVTDKPVRKMMKDFIMQPGVPLVTAQVKGNTLRLTQERFKTVEVQENFNQTWLIPLNLKIYDGSRIHHKQIVLDQVQKNFVFNELDSIVWLDLKEDVTGYYLMLLPADIMNRALNSGKLSDMEIQDVFNGWRFGWQAGKVNPVDILKLAYHFRNTANSAVINGLAGRIQDIKTFLSSTLPADLFIRYMDRTTAPMLEKLGLKVSLSLTGTEVLTQSTLISTLDHNPEIIKKVSELGREYLENQVLTNNHFIYLRTLFYNYGDDQLYESVLNKIKNTKIPSERNILIYALGYFPEKFIQKNLQLALTGDLEPNMRTWIPLYMNNMYRLERQNTGRRLQPNLLEWYKKHEDFYKETVSEAVLNHFLPKLVIDKADVDTFNRLFPEEKRAKTLQLELNKRISEIERKIKLNDLYAGKVKKYLQNFNDHIQ